MTDLQSAWSLVPKIHWSECAASIDCICGNNAEIYIDNEEPRECSQCGRVYHLSFELTVSERKV